MEPKKPQGSYFAKRCPERVQLDVLRPCPPLPDSLFMQQLAGKGNEFESETFDEIAAGVVGVAILVRDPEDRPAWEQATMSALSSRASIVVGGRLPVDLVGRRTGEPDLLIRAATEAEPTAPAGYFPADVKSHKVLEAPKSENGGTALVSPVMAPWMNKATVDVTRNARYRTPDLLQLAHYRRLLESAGMAAESENFGGIIGSEGVLVRTPRSIHPPSSEAIFGTCGQPSSSGVHGSESARSRRASADLRFERILRPRHSRIVLGPG
jgi:hypothetical protein